MFKSLKKYLQKFVVSDLLSGLTVSFAALSLGAAFGIQSGVGAFAGMLGAAIIPLVASTFGGTKIQASGPTAPMTAVTMLVFGYAINTYGTEGYMANQFIVLVFILTGIFLILFGVFKLGNLIKKIPHLVIIGFMDGIAILIWVDQFKTLFGLGGKNPLQGSLHRNILFAILTFILILIFPYILDKIRIPKKVKQILPSTLIAILVFTMIATIIGIHIETVSLGETINSFGEFGLKVANSFPVFSSLTRPILFKALGFALQLAILGYLDSLLTSVIIDKMTKIKTNRNKELIAQGLANGISGILGGIPGAQATIRSVLLIKEGAKTRIAGIFVGIFTLIGLFLFKGVVGLIPLAIFIGILFKVGLDVFDIKYIKDFIINKRYQDKKRILQLFFVLYTVLMTIFVNLNVAVFSATILFYIARYFNIISDISEVEDVTTKDED